MSGKTYVVVGGVAGGAGAAARLRRLDEDATIILYEKGPYVSFANCGLPYYAGGVIQDRERLLVTPPATFTDVFGIQLHTDTEVTAIDPKGKTVTVKGKDGKEQKQAYDALVLSPGAKPFVPPLPGVDDPAVLTVRNIPDIDRVVATMKKAKKAVVVGGGFIGLEMAENLSEKGIAVTLVEAAPQCMTPLDYDMAVFVHQALRSHGVELRLSSPLQKIVRTGDTVQVVLPDKTISDVDLVILSIGVMPDSHLAKEAGLSVDAKGYILVNEKFQTSDPFIWAIGDAIAFPSPFTGKPWAVALAGPANKMARLCADSIVLGKPTTPYPGTYGASVAKVFDLAAGSVGMNARTAAKEGLTFGVAVTHTPDHASYYPGSTQLTAKIVYEKPSGKLLGGQVVGYHGVDKKIDVLSVLLSHGGTVRDLESFEQAYAPPFNSAKDTLNMLGFIASNDLDGLDHLVDWQQAEEMVKNGAYLVDVRTAMEYSLGSISGAVNLPHASIREHLDKLPKDRPIVLMCAIGLRGHIAGRVLLQHGFTNVVNVTGGYKSWHAVIADKEAMTIKEEPKMEAKGDDSLTLDACGLQCPGPIVSLKQKMDSLDVGERLIVKATDPGFRSDVKSWCQMTGNTLEGVTEDGGIITASIKKGEQKEACSIPVCSKAATIIVFSNDFDRALAAFVLANGAAASGKPVTMFFTFWGLSVLRRKPDHRVKKDFMGKMFGAMLPKNLDDLSLSSMNFCGMGPKMMKGRMKKKQVDQLKTMFQTAKQNNVRFIACQMSMDIMGITKDELLDGVEVGGVGTYMGEASKGDVNLFI